CDRRDAPVGDAQKSAEADTAFHRALANSTRNSLLMWLIGQMNSVRSLDEWTRMRQLTLDNQIINQYNHQHREILNAIRSREPERAASKMKEHLETARLSLTRAAET
ncbi:MAG: FCD domain-containing protein, partial [Boseongicola sp.]|nr:FCD domain-containing protein [Boseongicola sp.]